MLSLLLLIAYRWKIGTLTPMTICSLLDGNVSRMLTAEISKKYSSIYRG